MASASENELRKRLLPETAEGDANIIAEDDDDDDDDDGETSGGSGMAATSTAQPSLAQLPYSGKVFMARKKKPDSLFVRLAEVLAVLGTIAFALYCYYYFENVHFHISRGYAHLGYAVAQHQVGQKYLHGFGVEKHPGKAMEWFRKAADQGHPHAAYNLAVGHLKGYDTDLKPGESHRLIHHAAAKGVKEAHEVLNTICTRGHCV